VIKLPYRRVLRRGTKTAANANYDRSGARRAALALLSAKSAFWHRPNLGNWRTADTSLLPFVPPPAQQKARATLADDAGSMMECPGSELGKQGFGA
jgi:hypothetical protein